MTENDCKKQQDKKLDIIRRLGNYIYGLDRENDAEQLTRLYEQIVLRLTRDLIDAGSKGEIAEALESIKIIMFSSHVLAFSHDVLTVYLAASHPNLEHHKKPLPPSWVDLEQEYLVERPAVSSGQGDLFENLS